MPHNLKLKIAEVDQGIYFNDLWKSFKHNTHTFDVFLNSL